MMDLKQSSTNGLNFKDLNKENLNGVRSQSRSEELDANDMLCLSDSENEEHSEVQSKPIAASVTESMKSSPQFLIEDNNMFETLGKVNGDVEFDAQAILNDDITTKSTESGKLVEDDVDIDIFAEEFLNEITENDKDDDDVVLNDDLDDQLLDDSSDAVLIDDAKNVEGKKNDEDQIKKIDVVEKEEIKEVKLENKEIKKDVEGENSGEKSEKIKTASDIEKEDSKNIAENVPEGEDHRADDQDCVADELENDEDAICLDAAQKNDKESNEKKNKTSEENDIMLEDENTSHKQDEPIVKDNENSGKSLKITSEDEIDSNDISSSDKPATNKIEQIDITDFEIVESKENAQSAKKDEEVEDISGKNLEELSQDAETDSESQTNKDPLALDITSLDGEKSSKDRSTENQDMCSEDNDVDSLLSQISEAIDAKETESNKIVNDAKTDDCLLEDIISLDSPMQVDALDEETTGEETSLDEVKPTEHDNKTDSRKKDSYKDLADSTKNEDSKNTKETDIESEDDDVVLLDGNADEKMDLTDSNEKEDTIKTIKENEKKNEIESEDDDLLMLPDQKDLIDSSEKDEKETKMLEEIDNEANDDEDDLLMLPNQKEVINEETDQKENVEKTEETKTEKTSDIQNIDDDDEVVLLDDDDKTEENPDKTVDVDPADDEEEEIFSVNTGAIEPTTVKNVDDVAEDLAEIDTKVTTESKKDADVVSSTAIDADTTDVSNSEANKDTNLVSDNSDNAQDKFPEESNATNEIIEETNSNDGDNNLLEEAASPQNSRSNDQFDEDKGKQSETENSELSQEPPNKKSRIEEDEEGKIDEITADLEESTSNKTVCKEEIDLEKRCSKRSLSPESASQDSKKIKVDGTDLLDRVSVKDEHNKLNNEKVAKVIEKSFIKKTPKVDLNLDFLKRFKKSINKMTKSDLEELVLQKIVEAIVHRSEFSEMRDLIEKQEKMIATHRTKISEITKQFRDLEMVHSRVVKDLEQKNQQFIMPVKITRAVGLQVLIPKRSDHATTTASTTVAKPTPSSDRSLLISNNVPSTPANASQPTQTPPAETKRLRCNQKITPLRPDTPQRTQLNSLQKISPASTPPTPSAQPPSQQSTPQNTPQNTPQHTPQNTPQHKPPVVYKTIIRNMSQAATAAASPGQGHAAQQTGPAMPVANNNQLITTTIRKSTATRPSPQQPTVQKQQVNVQSSPDRPRVPPMILKKTTNGRSLTIANPQTAATSQVAVQTQVTPPQAGGSANKSVIDLTDEDDKPTSSGPSLPALVAIPPQQKVMTGQPQNRVTTYVISKPNSAPQRVTVTQNGAVRPPPKTTYIPIAPKPVSTMVTPTLTAINTARLQAPAPAQTQPCYTRRATHPAPLPKPPHVASSPSWKAPPPRPTIRINNIDTGIVISWTMDDMNDSNAEVTSYQIYAYQETSAPPQVEAWRHVGDVKAMLLPMAVTLTQFQEGQRYFFAVRAVDNHSRYGPFSMPKTWS